MIRREKEGIEWLEFEQLQELPELFHAVLLNSHDFKKPGSHAALRELFDLSRVVRSHLVHGDQIEIVPHDSLPKCDGIMTKEKELGLVVTHADCQAALFYDPMTRVIANIHCGWRGNVQNIYGKTVDKLRDVWGVKPENLLVCISPSLGPEAAEFINYELELPPTFLPFQVKPSYFDLWAIAKAQLEEAGVITHHIEIAQLCTYYEKKDFFSYRRDKKTGRHGTVIAMRDFL